MLQCLSVETEWKNCEFVQMCGIIWPILRKNKLHKYIRTNELKYSYLALTSTVIAAANRINEVTWKLTSNAWFAM